MWLLGFLLGFLICGSVHAKVYEIAEPDFLAEIEAKKMEFVKKFARETAKTEKKFNSLSGVYLPSSKKNYTYYIDPTAELQADIPRTDKHGNITGILYRKGTRINPFDYIQVKPPPMIIFNACNSREVFLVKKIMKEKNRLSYILVSGGCSIQQIKDNRVYDLLKKRIYLLTDELVKKLKLKHTISYVDVDLKKRKIRIEVFKVSSD